MCVPSVVLLGQWHQSQLKNTNPKRVLEVRDPEEHMLETSAMQWSETRLGKCDEPARWASDTRNKRDAMA